MIQINLSEKQARELLACIGDSVRIVGAMAEVVNQIDKQLMPRSTNLAEFAAWKSERITPNLVEAWKRKHEPAEVTFADEINRGVDYSLQVGGALYEALKKVSEAKTND